MVVIPIINNGSVTKTCRYLYAGECPSRYSAFITWQSQWQSSATCSEMLPMKTAHSLCPSNCGMTPSKSPFAAYAAQAQRYSTCSRSAEVAVSIFCCMYMGSLEVPCIIVSCNTCFVDTIHELCRYLPPKILLL